MSFRNLDDVELQGRRALVRVDFNVPMSNGQVSDDTRLRAALPTISRLKHAGAKVILLAHFDRPKGTRVPSMSLEPIAGELARLLGAPVRFIGDCVGEAVTSAVGEMREGDVVLLENLRFHPGEELNDPNFVAALAANGDLFVNDAFSASHRSHASIDGIAHKLPAFAGEAMRRELEALESALGAPRRPLMGIVGGSKVSTKLDLLNNLVAKLDSLAIGGGMANTFLFAQGHDIAASFAEKDLADTARQIMRAAETAGCKLLLPIDVVVAERMEAGAPSRVCNLGELAASDRILDAGPDTVVQLTDAMDLAKTLVWNGPLGVFEIPPFDGATNAAARHAAARVEAGKLTAVAGGGDTVSALSHAGVAEQLSFVSTAGGAFLEWMEGRRLPGVAALQA